MVDYHSHILPRVDDGAANLGESLALLKQSYRQGVDVMVATCHFYGDEDTPKTFLERRNSAYLRLRQEMQGSADLYPLIVLGAEVLYFPGISQAEEIETLTIGCRSSILVEPPMARWTDQMLDELAELGKNLDCKVVVAHVDRYMQMLRDKTLIDRVLERELLVQVNGDYFLDRKTVKAAIQNLKKGKIHLIGSDCHNLTSRRPNLAEARIQAKAWGAEAEFQILEKNARELLSLGDYL